jgi:CheY-like chemotaxis protein
MRSEETTVLIVEDDPAIIELIKYSLREAAAFIFKGRAQFFALIHYDPDRYWSYIRN